MVRPGLESYSMGGYRSMHERLWYPDNDLPIHTQWALETLLQSEPPVGPIERAACDAEGDISYSVPLAYHTNQMVNIRCCMVHLFATYNNSQSQE